MSRARTHAAGRLPPLVTLLGLLAGLAPGCAPAARADEPEEPTIQSIQQQIDAYKKQNGLA